MFGRKRKQAFDEDIYSDYGYDLAEDLYAPEPAEEDDASMQDDYDTGWEDPGDESPGQHRRKRSSVNVSAILIAVAAVLAVYLIVCSIFGPRYLQCRETVSIAQTAINDLDVYALCDVIDPSIGRKLSAVVILGSAASSGMSDLLVDGLESLGLNLGTDAEGNTVTDLLKTVQLKPYRISLPALTRYVWCNVEIDGHRVDRIRLELRKKAGDVYIRRITPAK